MCLKYVEELKDFVVISTQRFKMADILKFSPTRSTFKKKKSHRYKSET